MHAKKFAAMMEVQSSNGNKSPGRPKFGGDFEEIEGYAKIPTPIMGFRNGEGKKCTINQNMGDDINETEESPISGKTCNVSRAEEESRSEVINLPPPKVDSIENQNVQGIQKFPRLSRKRQLEALPTLNEDYSRGKGLTSRDANNLLLSNGDCATSYASLTVESAVAVGHGKFAEPRGEVNDLLHCRPSFLQLPQLTTEEKAKVKQGINDDGPLDEIIVTVGPESVQRQSLHRLRPTGWLNDEILHSFWELLSVREDELCRKNGNRLRTHFFKSFFMTKLLNIGAEPPIGETFEYQRVQSWSRRVYGGDIFNLSKVVFPINVRQIHWFCVVAFMQEKRIQFYDAKGSSGESYLRHVFQYIQDEHLDKKGKQLQNPEEWALIPCDSNTPQQENGESERCLATSFVPPNGLQRYV